MLSRLCYGARVSVLISVTSTLIAMTVGGMLGLLAVSSKAVFTYIVETLMNSILAVPPLLLLLAIVVALHPTPGVLIAALSLTFVPAFLRLTRANALAQMSRDYVLAARGLGASRWRVMLWEVLPNAMLPVLSYAALVLPAIIVAEGSLSFLGFGVQSPTPSWGGMIAESETTLTQHPWQGLIPCIVLFMTVLSLNTLGDALRKRLAQE
jgi:peptide/nickel transport system permease protein